MSKYGIQLYSVKDFMEQSVEETLKQVAEMGYTMVEPAGYYDVSAEDFKGYCDKYGLTVCSTHNGLWTINKGNFDSTVAYLKKIGCTRFIMPNCGYDTKEKLDASIEQMNEYGPRLAAEGLELMYHNHCEEFEFNEDGVIPMVEILKRTNIKLQVDIYWIYRAGISPIYFLEQFKGTLYRQTMFAEFELNIGKMVSQGQTLTADNLSQEYRRLNALYFGEDMVVDDQIAMEWARIPHFYYNYYVFQYATGYAAAIALSRRILNEGESAVKDYIEFLSGGCTKSPIDLLKGAGVDMTTSEPVEKALELFGELLDEMEGLVGEDG